MPPPGLMLLAWTLEIVLGWPDGLYRRIGHPVVWFAGLVSTLERTLNRKVWSHRARYGAGMVSALLAVGAATLIAAGIAALVPKTWWGVVLEALIASSLLASRSLHAHVDAVARPLASGDLARARHAVSMIVGRDPDPLDEAGLARASLESLSENASDGVIAPLLWGSILGLPGLAAYKAINTLDSMIGHRTEQFAAFGGFAARLDDIANFVPARLTGCLIALASLRVSAVRVMARDGGLHRSPNAGWPEAAMAGALGVRLSGPRVYGGHISDEPWLNDGARDPGAADMKAGLALYRRAMAVAGVGLALVTAGYAA